VISVKFFLLPCKQNHRLPAQSGSPWEAVGGRCQRDGRLQFVADTVAEVLARIERRPSRSSAISGDCWDANRFAHALDDPVFEVVGGEACGCQCQSHDSKQTQLIIDVGATTTRGGLNATAEERYSRDVRSAGQWRAASRSVSFAVPLRFRGDWFRLKEDRYDASR
jgi:hypothetical protein